ncbi:MAG: hypothetical protein Ta2E_02250 [Mycoplasmoidaceae bacterium]|nr:MAG: hypothetical protein Ta2E_02250 [Mycoplasmoidaceae bacterium]
MKHKLSKLLLPLFVGTVTVTTTMISTACNKNQKYYDITDIIANTNDAYFSDLRDDVVTNEWTIECKKNNPDASKLRNIEYTDNKLLITSKIAESILSDQTKLDSIINVSIMPTREDDLAMEYYQNIYYDSSIDLGDREEAFYREMLLRTKYYMMFVLKEVEFIPYVQASMSNPDLTERMYDAYKEQVKIVKPSDYKKLETKIKKLSTDNYVDPDYMGWSEFDDFDNASYNSNKLSWETMVYFRTGTSPMFLDYFVNTQENSTNRLIDIYMVDCKPGKWYDALVLFDNPDFLVGLYDMFPIGILFTKYVNYEKKELHLYVQRDIL